MSGVEISQHLGFSDPAYFYLSVKQWTGMTFTEIKQKMTRIIRNSENTITNQSTNIKKYKLSELPDGLGRLIASSPSRKTTSDYK